MQPTNGGWNEKGGVQIKKWCKLGRGFKGKRRKTNGHKTRAVCIYILGEKTGFLTHYSLSVTKDCVKNGSILRRGHFYQHNPIIHQTWIVYFIFYFIFIGPCIITYEFLNVTNEMQLLKTLLLSLLYMFRALFAHHQELTETVPAAYSDGMW